MSFQRLLIWLPSFVLALWIFPAWSAAGRAGEAPTVELPRTALEPGQLAVIVNEADPQSVQVADYYRQRRGIPDANVIRVRFKAGESNLPREEFERVKREVDALTPPTVQAFALAWTAPYRVDCMSITSAFALRFDPAFCSTQRCALTRAVGYFNSSSDAPHTQQKLRPAMMLAGKSFEDAKALIDRGVASDYTYPRGTGYLLSTSDRSRTVRDVLFPEVRARLAQVFRLEYPKADFIENRKDVLFYFTGMVDVKFLDTLHFLPGAVADHLTSAGGQLTDSGQMSSLRWLEAGATASYGTVVEPCNLLTKFPHPGILMWYYATGNTVLEAYWKSVAMPGEGVFIGEPLAKPFGAKLLGVDGRRARIKLFAPGRNLLGVEAAASPIGPYRLMDKAYVLAPGPNEVTIALPPGLEHFRLKLLRQ